MAESKTINPWEQIIKNPTSGYKEYFKEEEEYLKKNILAGSIVLEVGCGSGRSLKNLSPLATKVYGIDNDSEAIRLCNKKSKKSHNIEIFLEDGEKMHFSNESIDIVFIGLTFSNFGKSKNIILSEIYRVLKDNGILIFSAYNEDALSERLKNYKRTTPGRFVYTSNGTVILDNKYISEQFTKKELGNILYKQGFHIIDIIKTKLVYIIKAKKTTE